MNAPPAPSGTAQGVNLALSDVVTGMPPVGQWARATGARREPLASTSATREADDRARMADSLTRHRGGCLRSGPFVLRPSAQRRRYQVARETALHPSRLRRVVYHHSVACR